MHRTLHTAIHTSIAFIMLGVLIGPVPHTAFGWTRPTDDASGPAMLLISDASFGDNGRITTNFVRLQTNTITTDVIAQPDGKVLSLVRSCQSPYTINDALIGCNVTLLTRYTATGIRDVTFGANGVVTVPLTFTFSASSIPGDVSQHLALQADGKVVIVGAKDGRGAIMRYTSGGIADAVFGDNGIAFANGGIIEIGAIALQRDEKIVVTGAVGAADWLCRAAVARFTPLGQIDSTFGTGGFTSCDGNLGAYRFLSDPRMIRIQSNGFIVVMSDRGILFRLSPNGAVDQTFGMFDGAPVFVQSGVVEFQLTPDDKILMGAFGYPSRFQRLTSSGKPDVGFGTNGVITPTFATLSTTSPIATVMLPDGEFVRVGIGYYLHPKPTPLNPDCCPVRVLFLSRHNSDGNLNASFGAGGVVTSTVDALEQTPTALALQSDGKFVVGSAFQQGPRTEAVVSRYLANGVSDLGFGDAGRATLTAFTGSLDGITQLRMQSDGKLMAFGTSFVEQGRTKLSVARYTPEGSLDPTFGNGGKALPAFDLGGNGIVWQYKLDVARQQDGKWVMAALVSSPDNRAGFGLLRLNTDGTADTSFGTNGIVTTALVSYSVSLPRVGVQPDGKLVVVGDLCRFVSNNSCNHELRLTRFLTNGALDLSFGTSGVVTSSVSELPIGMNTNQPAFAMLPDGSSLIGGIKRIAPSNFDTVYTYTLGVMRFTPSGQVDTLFGVHGSSTITFNASLIGSGLYFADALMSISPSGQIALLTIGTGMSSKGPVGSTGIIIGRFNPDGSPDNSFGVGGLVRPNGTGTSPQFVRWRSDGKMYISGGTSISIGSIGSYPVYKYIGQSVARMMPNGALDASFGSAGVTIAADAPSADLVIDSNDRLAFGGTTSQPSGETDFAVQRYREFTPTQSIHLPFIGQNTYKSGYLP